MCLFYIFMILSCRYDGNVGLHKSKRYTIHYKLIVGVSLGVLVLLIILILGSLLLLRKIRRRTAPYQKRGLYSRNLLKTLLDHQIYLIFKLSHFLWTLGGSMQTSTKRSSGYSIGKGDEGVAYYLSLSELEEATNNFSKKIGKGSFGSVYYGKMTDGKEVAVKIMAESSTHGNQQFITEVRHRPFIGLISLCSYDFKLLEMRQSVP